MEKLNMGMLSYKQYKLLHENLDSVIGVSTPKSIGLQNEAPQLFGMMSKMAKKMGGDVPPGLGKKKPPMGPDMGDDMGGEMGPDMGDDMEDMGDDEEMGDEEGGDMEDMGDDEEMGDEEGGDMEDMGDDEEGDEEDMGDEDMGDAGPMGAGSPPPGMGGAMGGPDMAAGLGGPMGKKKKPMPPMMMNKMGGSMFMKKEAAVDPQDAKMKAQNRKNKANDQKDDGTGTAQKKTTTVREGKCCDKCGNMMNKKCNKMTKEQNEFNDSLMRQAGALKFAKDELGFWVPVTEDVLIKNPEVEDNEPQPGEVGFATQQKLGISGSNFTEWANYHAKQVKKNRKKR